jgi:hypothetical protein
MDNFVETQRDRHPSPTDQQKEGIQQEKTKIKVLLTPMNDGQFSLDAGIIYFPLFLPF